ncbi:MAG: four-helix bundle copper-binding protein [Bacillota bacterium]
MPEHFDQFMSMNPESHHHPHERLVAIIQNCEAVCEHMTTFLMRSHNPHMRMMQLQLLRDCADVCGLTAKCIARMSPLAKCIANLCAYVCDMCGNECMKFPDPESQSCARICHHCARECRMFAMM